MYANKLSSDWSIRTKTKTHAEYLSHERWGGTFASLNKLLLNGPKPRAQCLKVRKDGYCDRSAQALPLRLMGSAEIEVDLFFDEFFSVDIAAFAFQRLAIGAPAAIVDRQVRYAKDLLYCRSQHNKAEVSQCSISVVFKLSGFRRNNYVNSSSRGESMAPSSTAPGGFSFDNVIRNNLLQQKGYAAPTARKTGTTIAGVVFTGGVILGADTRATAGATVFQKDCQKIHYIADTIMCCGAGTAADTDATTQLISSQLALHSLATRRAPRVATALNMLKQMLFRYQGHISAALVLGGVDFNGPHLYTVYPHGSTDRLPYVTMGSGSLAAMAVFEANYKEDMTAEEAKQLVYEGISAGIFNDLGSGGNVDICVITKDGKELIRGFAKENERKYRRPAGYKFPQGATPVVPGAETFKGPEKEFAVVADAAAQESMDVSA